MVKKAAISKKMSWFRDLEEPLMFRQKLEAPKEKQAECMTPKIGTQRA